jgi:DNA-binding NarL/FixJ family response regulator
MFEEGEQAEAMRRAGAVAYLTKSGPMSALLEEIRRCVALESTTAASGPHPRAPARAPHGGSRDENPRS